ncbi:hypothetical protein BC835DRAFT_1423438 [Cytidiella melzeri]|nr:hypothetical protein BC835DRAFT_1423438 [Cytidiella melzeri]
MRFSAIVALIFVATASLALSAPIPRNVNPDPNMSVPHSGPPGNVASITPILSDTGLIRKREHPPILAGTESATNSRPTTESVSHPLRTRHSPLLGSDVDHVLDERDVDDLKEMTARSSGLRRDNSLVAREVDGRLILAGLVALWIGATASAGVLYKHYHNKDHKDK